MSRVFHLSLFLAVLASVYTLWLQPILVVFGLGRVIQPGLGNSDCTIVSALAACEKIILHSSTGVLYLACSSPASRAHWTPAVSLLNASGPDVDYIATYVPDSGVVAHLQTPFPLSLHGMDVVPSASNSSELYIYAINHRKPSDRRTALSAGADSTVEIFKMHFGGTTLTHLHTVRDPVILTPNDIVGSPDGHSFFFTNDHASKTGPMRYVSLIGFESGSVGYCDIASGCKIAAQNIHGANGIVKSPNNDTFFIANSIFGGITVMERQSDNALLKTHVIPTDRGLDNLSIDTDGVVWAAGIPFMFTMIRHIADPSLLSPASAHSVAQNTGPSSFYGDKFKVTKVFEDDGRVASGTTTVVHDAQRNRLFLHGIASSHLTVC
ncbi:hypothetical protein GGX14DRAFT_520719 [Mycena pura]|uniref:SMP-30/Gluconolactonase/LRE-like region domain-containing protein n=1 Tax=Mycena pura TaxID=153505 RepID=A0AAD6VK99_9AGAR|nr:hypothetical protein GGX14DRAFT_520719 [Mycena pura]